MWSPARAVTIWLLLEFFGGLAVSMAISGTNDKANHEAGAALAPIMLITGFVVYIVQRTRHDRAREREEEARKKAKVFE
jgi:hypothetical protein